MHVDVAAVLAEGRRRQTRRTVRWAAIATASTAAAAVVVALALQGDPSDRTAPPVGTSRPSATTAALVESHTPGVQ